LNSWLCDPVIYEINKLVKNPTPVDVEFDSLA